MRIQNRFLRVLGEAICWIVYAGLIAILASCASVPPSVDRPQVGCEFDNQMRFRYALVIERDDVVTRWVLRQMMTAVRDPYDPDIHVSPTVKVRSGYCPDESQSRFARIK